MRFCLASGEERSSLRATDDEAKLRMYSDLGTAIFRSGTRCARSAWRTNMLDERQKWLMTNGQFHLHSGVYGCYSKSNSSAYAVDFGGRCGASGDECRRFSPAATEGKLPKVSGCAGKGDSMK